MWICSNATIQLLHNISFDSYIIRFHIIHQIEDWINPDNSTASVFGILQFMDLPRIRWRMLSHVKAWEKREDETINTNSCIAAEGWCPRTWDGWLCWSDAPPNRDQQEKCPAYTTSSLESCTDCEKANVYLFRGWSLGDINPCDIRCSLRDEEVYQWREMVSV